MQEEIKFLFVKSTDDILIEENINSNVFEMGEVGEGKRLRKNNES